MKPAFSRIALGMQSCHESMHLLQPEGDEIQHGGELAEDDGLAAGVALHHVLQLLPQRLDLGAALEVGQADAVHNAVLAAARQSRGHCLQASPIPGSGSGYCHAAHLLA